MKFKRSKDASWKIVDGNECVILHLKTGDYYSVNDLGREIWELCDGVHTVDAIQSRLAASRPENAGKIRRDVESFLGRLRKEGLVEDLR